MCAGPYLHENGKQYTFPAAFPPIQHLFFSHKCITDVFHVSTGRASSKYDTQFKYLSIDRHLEIFHILSTINKAAMTNHRDTYLVT